MRPIVHLDALGIDQILYDFVNREAMPGTRVREQPFWAGFASLVRNLAPRNAVLLARRDELQSKIDAWHRRFPGAAFDRAQYRAYLAEIGYLQPEQGAFAIDTAQVDPEIAEIAGPQLVVPVSNARYALNAANARWGSLYDALYGTDAIAPQPAAASGGRAGAGAGAGAGKYDPLRGAKVIAFARDFLDAHFALLEGSHHDAVEYRPAGQNLDVRLESGAVTALKEAAAFRGHQGDRGSPSVLLLIHHGLHVELHIDRAHHIGRDDPAGISDIWLESAITAIQDCEDSVAAVNADEKVQLYRNWLGLMNGSLTARIEKGGKLISRRLNEDRRYRTPDGTELVLPGRSLMLVRNVGHHMMSDAVTLDGKPIPETFIDAAVTALIALHDLRGGAARRNSRSGSVYIVKPKMHGPEEVAFADELFGAVEQLLGLAQNTLKIGIMDEERRTSVNLAECIARPGTGWCSSTPAFSIAPAMKFTHRWRPRPCRARTTSRRPSGSMPTSARTSTSGWPAACAAERRSARACGPCRTSWRLCSRPKLASLAPVRIPPGCPPRPPPRCTPCTITR